MAMSVFFSILNTDSDTGITLLHNQVEIVTLNDVKALYYFYNITAEWQFVIIQAHTKWLNLSLSATYNRETYESSSTAILRPISYKSRLIREVSADVRHLDYNLKPLKLRKGSSIETLVTAVDYTGPVPIPGGCCLTCELEIDPNLVITSQGYYKTLLSFSVANVYDYVTSLCGGLPGENPHHYRLRYSVYQYFLEEGNLDDKELFDGLSKMLTPSSVKQHGTKVHEWNPKKDLPYLVFDTTRGQGIIFNILIYDPLTKMESVYSPAVTYGCSFTAKVDGCDSLGSVVNIVFAVSGALLGLFICFFGHRMYQLYIILCGLTLFSFLSFVLLANETEWSHTARMIGSACFGVVFAAFLYLFWWWTGYRHVVLYICGLVLGFLLAAILFFTPFGNFQYWNSDVNYWTVVMCISLTFPFFFLLCLKQSLILVASSVGAYGFVVGIDTFIHSSLSYIVLNVIMKATVDDFVKYDVPFQSKDCILVAVWVVLALLGLVVQLYMSKGQTTLPWTPRSKKRRTKNIQWNRNPYAASASQSTQGGDSPALVSTRDNRGLDNQTDDERLPILVESRPVVPRTQTGNDQRLTRYGTNIVC